jgi:uncharacterized membrane protein (DUF373 family)
MDAGFRDEEQEKPSLIVRILSIAEHGVLALVAVALVILSIFLLIQGVYSLALAIKAGAIHDQAVPIMDDILLVLMTMEIVYTVTLSIESHKLQAEPFLVIGTIAAIRRMLVITAESSQLITQSGKFQSMILELALLCVIIIIMSLSIFILRRSECFKLQVQMALKKQFDEQDKQKEAAIQKPE